MSFLPLHGNSNRGPVPCLFGLVRFICWSLVICFTISCSSSFPSAPSGGSAKVQSTSHDSKNTAVNYQDSVTCRNCHATIYQQYMDSMHARSFENPLVKAIFFETLLPRATESELLSSEVRACLACHSPLTYVTTGGHIDNLPDRSQYRAGVECDLCHTVRGYTGAKPEGGNFISTPGIQKLGPFPYKDDHHRSYSELHTKSEFCAVCHNRTNRYGLEIISTFSEWKESQYAEDGIECQHCHMNVNGFLTGGQPVYESGAAAEGTLFKSKKRERLYTHRFPGAHSESQVIGAINLEIEVDRSTVVAGQEMLIYVQVDNSKSGHKFPTGSAELRLLYLDLVAKVNGELFPVTANSLNQEMLDVAGKGKFDSEVIGKDITPGSRVYRAICVDPEGQQALFSFDAHNIIFDNRLNAGEIRQEFYTFKIPEEAGTEFTLEARLKYLRYPRSLAEKLGVAAAKSIELATVRKNIVLGEK